MSAIDDINAAIVEAAQNPKRMRHGNREVEQHSIRDLLEAAEHVAGETSSEQPHFGMRFTKLVPPPAG